MLGRILRSADFERVLGVPVCARSAHFAVHFLDGSPARARIRSAVAQLGPEPDSAKLSTDDSPTSAQPVDDTCREPRVSGGPRPPQLWLGSVVPKRHARRAVTRTLLKRQIRAAMLRRVAAEPLPAGLWVVRLRAPFDRAVFASAASDALRGAARGELDAVLLQAGRKLAAAQSEAPGAR